MSSDKALPWFPYYIADWTHATAHLNALERGVYIALVEVYWTRGSLVNDNARLAAIPRARQRSGLRPLPRPWAGPSTARAPPSSIQASTGSNRSSLKKYATSGRPALRASRPGGSALGRTVMLPKAPPPTAMMTSKNPVNRPVLPIQNPEPRTQNPNKPSKTRHRTARDALSGLI